jgi:hypothetical protein
MPEPLPIQATTLAPNPIVPPGIPPTDPTKPQWALTQDQITWLASEVVYFWPAVKQFWPIIVMVMAGLGVTGFSAGRYTAPASSPAAAVAPTPPVTINNFHTPLTDPAIDGKTPQPKQEAKTPATVVKEAGK